MRLYAKYLLMLMVLFVMTGLWTFAASQPEQPPSSTTSPQLSAGRILLAAAWTPSPGKEAEGAITISQEVKKVDSKVKPKIVHMVKPVYPPEAKKKGIEGQVRINVVVNTKGEVSETEVLSGPEELRASTEEAVRQWRYEPVGVDFKATIDVNYKLKHEEKPAEPKAKPS
ncbi:MAG: energy transducer TonB [Acidobacteriia bacterium]|nr:energy transducer TonB [Terriglobia bacterium]